MTQIIERKSGSYILGRPSVSFLIVINLIPLVGVFAFGWNAGFLMLVYWMETVVIGLFNIPKLLTSRRGREGSPWWLIWLGNLFITAFFCVHYGMFNFGHVMFLQTLFDLPPIGLDVLIVAGGLSLSHAFSLIVNWFGKREYDEVAVNEQMFKPYGRVVIMHVAIILGGFFLVGSDGAALGPLVFLVALKTGSDVLAHAVSHGWIKLQPETA
ncbi:hypothetical protein GCM10007853_08250 [Algimonas ampicilliniresistens]|uniref:Uncharacterized protein n=1 Tax=Algimonas ampicilliniresistens TaxID=1298735 RepID=A0ABQ5V5X8_9PROT|nr:DUF6498-containing protein [Algimonas ampicilliniresistens]GLQ22951.1 hypothetical protein GCM10007853_08250 [Algimonas ampicilliniresistens]